jgi:hypothetical protein
MGYLGPGGYSLRLHHSSTSPLDSTTYYFGGTNNAWTTTTTRSRVYIPQSGIIRIINYFFTCTSGTNENLEFYIRINGTTDYAVDTAFPISANEVVVSNYNLAIPVQAGDYLEIKVVTPAWVTNPTGILGGGHIIIQ